MYVHTRDGQQLQVYSIRITCTEVPSFISLNSVITDIIDQYQSCSVFHPEIFSRGGNQKFPGIVGGKHKTSVLYLDVPRGGK